MPSTTATAFRTRWEASGHSRDDRDPSPRSSRADRSVSNAGPIGRVCVPLIALTQRPALPDCTRSTTHTSDGPTTPSRPIAAILAAARDRRNDRDPQNPRDPGPFANRRALCRSRSNAEDRPRSGRGDRFVAYPPSAAQATVIRARSIQTGGSRYIPSDPRPTAPPGVLPPSGAMGAPRCAGLRQSERISAVLNAVAKIGTPVKSSR